MNYRIVLFGAKETTLTIASYMVENNYPLDCIVTVDEDKVHKEIISGYASMDSFARENAVSLYKVPDYAMKSRAVSAFFEDNSFDLGISMGWQRLIPKDILDSFRYGVYGFHGSCGYLPYGRGRSPMNWSIINGDERLILNMFKYDEYVDSPNVYMNTQFEINCHDTITTLQYKNLICSKNMITKLVEDYNQGIININCSSKDFSSLYPKRTPEDGKIDFIAKTRNIYNLIRGVTHPFPGAFCFVDHDKEKRVLIWKAVPFDNMLNFSSYAPGEIIDVFDRNLIVRTVDGSLMVTEYSYDGVLCAGCILT